MVDLSPIVTALVEHPARVKEQLLLNGAIILRSRHLTNIAEPVSVGAYLALNILKRLLAAVEFIQVYTIVYLLVAWIANNAETVDNMSISRHGLEAYRHILPRAVEVLVAKRVALVELITLVLVIYLIV